MVALDPFSLVVVGIEKQSFTSKRTALIELAEVHFEKEK